MAAAIATVPASWVPQMSTGWGEVLLGVARVLPGEISRDQQALYFAGAFVDLRDARVAVMTLDGIVVQVAIAAADLDRLGAHRFGELGGVELRLRGFREAGKAFGAHARRMQDEQPGGVDARMHVGEIIADRRMLDQFLAELSAVLGIGQCRLE